MGNCRASTDEEERDREQTKLDDLLEKFKSSLKYEVAVTSKFIELINDPDLVSRIRANAEEYVEENWRDYE